MSEKETLTEKARKDLELVERALGNDEAAYAELLLKYKDPIYYMILKMVKNKADAEDLTLEAFGKAFANLKAYSSDYAFSTWLYRIATNNSIDFIRKQKGVHYSIDQEMDDEPEMSNLKLKSAVPNPEEELIVKQRGVWLRSFVDQLNPKYQNLINLRYFKEYSYEEIAKELDLPLGTVKVQLFRARNKLFKLMQQDNVKE